MHVSSVNHVLLFHTTPLPACTYCRNFSSSVHVGALSQPFYTPVYHCLQYAKMEGESYHVTHGTGSTCHASSQQQSSTCTRPILHSVLWKWYKHLQSYIKHIQV